LACPSVWGCALAMARDTANAISGTAPKTQNDKKVTKPFFHGLLERSGGWIPNQVHDDLKGREIGNRISSLRDRIWLRNSCMLFPLISYE
jgi:hypothetical protein